MQPARKGRTLPAGAHGYGNCYSDMQGIFLAMGPGKAAAVLWQTKNLSQVEVDSMLPGFMLTSNFW